MGTNYYIESDTCASCGHTPEPLHIGKSSAGWCFALHVYPERGIVDLDDWQKEWHGKRIKDEYGLDIAPAELLKTITDRSAERPLDTINYKWLRANYATVGPNGLARHNHSPSLHHHGAGTWDCLVGDFS